MTGKRPEGDLLGRRPFLLGAAAVGATAVCGPLPAHARPRQTVWTFDRLDRIGGVAAHAEGGPTIIDTPLGKAMHFDGVDDVLFVDEHPFAGAAHFTFEAVFRPDGGAFAQRWFHLASDDPGPGMKSGDTRCLFEIRVHDANWCLDAFVKGPNYNQTLLFDSKLHPVGHWYHVAQSYDGTTYRSYVNGQLQGEAAVAFTPQGPGKASIGARMNRVNYFNGAVRKARFSREALAPSKFDLVGLT
jgi:hypothetical protein